MSELRDRLRENLLPYSRLAFHLLPPREYARVLDIGCGRGVPTLLLADLTGGEVVGLDLDPRALEACRRGARERGLGERVATCQASLTDIPFPDGSFDLIWCEGALSVMGFGESVRRWRRLLVPGGYLVAHDDAGDVGGKARAAGEGGFVLHAVFVVPEEVWWRDYCAPAEVAVKGLDLAAADVDPDHTALAEEIRRYREDPESFRSAFFVMERVDGA